MDFIKVIFAVVLMFAAQRGSTPDDQVRLNGVSQDIWRNASSQPEPLIKGEAGTVAVGLVLATIAGHESGFWSKVQDCSACFIGSQHCDRGMSISLYQLRVNSGAWGEYTRDQICQDNSLATERALAILSRHRKASTPLALFKGYARGGRRQAPFEMDAMFSRACSKAGVFVTYRDGSLTASWMKGRKPEPDQQQAVVE